MPIYEKLMGNPFVDAGVCGICEWLGRGVQPEQITKADLEKIVKAFVDLAANWDKWASIFTINHPLINPSAKKKPSEKKSLTIVTRFRTVKLKISSTSDSKTDLREHCVIILTTRLILAEAVIV